jgi:hypothetical protein
LLLLFLLLPALIGSQRFLLFDHIEGGALRAERSRRSGERARQVIIIFLVVLS